MTAFTLFHVDPNAQSGANTTTPEIIFFNVVSVNTLREGNETAASIKPNDEDGWFMLWGCLSIGLVLSALAMAEHTYRHCNNPHRQHGSANDQAGCHQEYRLSEEAKEEVVNPAGGAGNTDLGLPAV
ncbi:MAG TPA: hypothetical protein DCL40_04410 [Coxiellaceae bacterium]|nr:hypothetical protein [Coxiellaceae bacterium]